MTYKIKIFKNPALVFLGSIEFLVPFEFSNKVCRTQIYILTH